MRPVKPGEGNGPQVAQQWKRPRRMKGSTMRSHGSRGSWAVILKAHAAG